MGRAEILNNRASILPAFHFYPISLIRPHVRVLKTASDMDTMSQTTGDPPLLRIPPEVRLHIYDHLGILQHKPVSIHHVSRPPAIGRTCTRLREEVLDLFFSRNRFVASSLMGLSDTLNKTLAENVARIEHLRLSHLGNDSSSSRIEQGDCVPSGIMHIDVDILRTDPFYRVGGKTEVPEGRFEPAVTRDGLNKLYSMPQLMKEVMQLLVSERRDVDGVDLVRLDAEMLEDIVLHWVWVSHMLTCGQSEPAVCDNCVRAVTCSEIEGRECEDEEDESEEVKVGEEFVKEVGANEKVVKEETAQEKEAEEETVEENEAAKNEHAEKEAEKGEAGKPRS